MISMNKSPKESMPPFDAFVFGKVMQDMAWNVDGARKPATRVNWWIAVNIYRTPHGFLPQWLASVQIFKSDCKEPKSHLGWKLNRQFLNWLTYAMRDTAASSFVLPWKRTNGYAFSTRTVTSWTRGSLRLSPSWKLWNSTLWMKKLLQLLPETKNPKHI